MAKGLEIEPNAEFQGLIDFARTITAGGLGRERTPERSQKLFRKAALMTDKSIRDFLTLLDRMSPKEREEKRPKCVSGCAHCCYQWVRVTALEVIAVSASIRDTWSPEEIEALVGHLEAYREEFRSMAPGSLFSMRCPLLNEENNCRVYESRPFICRGANSMDASFCEQARLNPNEGAQVPTIMPVLYSAGAIRQGIFLGLQDAGYRDGELVLALALQTALRQQDAAERFFAGENVFKDDVIPPD